jgi:mannose-6-phosphate isomerase-like protein (cupin superfamily)
VPIKIGKPNRIIVEHGAPKIIDEYFGLVNSGTSEVSIARMQAPPGWKEPPQIPEFNEYTLVLNGVLFVESKIGSLQDKRNKFTSENEPESQLLPEDELTHERITASKQVFENEAQLKHKFLPEEELTHERITASKQVFENMGGDKLNRLNSALTENSIPDNTSTAKSTEAFPYQDDSTQSHFRTGKTGTYTQEIKAGEAILIPKGEWVRYSTSETEGAEYIAVCLPAFSPETVHRQG